MLYRQRYGDLDKSIVPTHSSTPPKTELPVFAESSIKDLVFNFMCSMGSINSMDSVDSVGVRMHSTKLVLVCFANPSRNKKGMKRRKKEEVL